MVLALGFRDKLTPELWMSTGAAGKRPFIPVHKINIPDTMAKNIIAFHAMTGCDTVSQFAGKGKKTTWKSYSKSPELLSLLGSSAELSPQLVSDAEIFACKLYTKDDNCSSINEVRVKVFMEGKSLDAMAPTKDALEKHIAGANYQCLVWKGSLTTTPELPNPTACGWIEDDGCLIPQWTTLPPVPRACKELLTCSCKTGCGKRCGCYRAGQKTCTMACGCQGTCRMYDGEDEEHGGGDDEYLING